MADSLHLSVIHVVFLNFQVTVLTLLSPLPWWQLSSLIQFYHEVHKHFNHLPVNNAIHIYLQNSQSHTSKTDLCPKKITKGQVPSSCPCCCPAAAVVALSCICLTLYLPLCCHLLGEGWGYRWEGRMRKSREGGKNENRRKKNGRLQKVKRGRKKRDKRYSWRKQQQSKDKRTDRQEKRNVTGRDDGMLLVSINTSMQRGHKASNIHTIHQRH